MARTTTTTEGTTSEALAEQAERIAAQAAQIQAEQERRAQQEYERLAAHQDRFDAELVATYDADPFKAAVTQARQAVEQAIAEHPLTKALSDYHRASARHREAFEQYIGALGRQGRDVSGATYPQTQAIDVMDRMRHQAEEAGTVCRLQSADDFHARRNNPEETT